MARAQIETLVTEINRKLRDVRGQQPDLDDTQAVRARNTQIQRLSTALRLIEQRRRQHR